MGLFYKECALCGKEHDRMSMEKVDNLGFICWPCRDLACTWGERNGHWPNSRDDYLHFYKMGLEMQTKQEKFEQEIQKRKQIWYDEFEEAYSIGPLSLDVRHGLLGYRTSSGFRAKMNGHCLGSMKSSVIFPISVIRSMKACTVGDRIHTAYRNDHIDSIPNAKHNVCLSIKTAFAEYCFYSIPDSPDLIDVEKHQGTEWFHHEAPPGLLRFCTQIHIALSDMHFDNDYHGYIKPEVDAFHQYVASHQREWMDLFQADMNCDGTLYLDKKHCLLACYYDDPKRFFTLCGADGRIKDKYKTSKKLKIYPTRSMRNFSYQNYGSGDYSAGGINRQILMIETDVGHIAFFLREKWENNPFYGEYRLPTLDPLLNEILRMNAHN